MNNKVVKIGIAVVCLVAAAVLFARYLGGDAALRSSASDERPLKCTACEHTYVITGGEFLKQVQEIEAAGKGGTIEYPPLICPKCGEQTAMRATKCEKCGNLYIMGESGDSILPDKCPKCDYSAMENVGKK